MYLQLWFLSFTNYDCTYCIERVDKTELVKHVAFEMQVVLQYEYFWVTSLAFKSSKVHTVKRAVRHGLYMQQNRFHVII